LAEIKVFRQKVPLYVLVNTHFYFACQGMRAQIDPELRSAKSVTIQIG
jgi:hypothetical protein